MTSLLRDRRLLGLLLVGIPQPTRLWDHPGWDILRLQAPPCLVGLHLDERAGLSSRSVCSRFLRFDTRPFDFLQVLMAFSPLECRVLWIGYLVGQLLRGPQTLQCTTLCRVWNAGYLFRFSLRGALMWGRTYFLSSSCWSQALRTLSSPSGGQFTFAHGPVCPSLLPNFLGGRWGPLTRDLPSLQLRMPRPISFMQVSCCGWGNKVCSSRCVVTSRSFPFTVVSESSWVDACFPTVRVSCSSVRACSFLSLEFPGWGPKRFPVPALGHQRMDILRVRALAGSINRWTYPGAL